MKKGDMVIVKDDSHNFIHQYLTIHKGEGFSHAWNGTGIFERDDGSALWIRIEVKGYVQAFGLYKYNIHKIEHVPEELFKI